MVQQFITLALFVCVLSSCKVLDFSYESSIATAEEKDAILNAAKSYEYTPYFYGGDSYSGIDCSGLVISAINKLGFYVFMGSDGYSNDVNANDLHEFNTYHTDTPMEGDLIFFDADNNGIQEHVSIFIGWADSGNPIVYDAYSITGYVSTREVYNYMDKSPSFGELIIYR